MKASDVKNKCFIIWSNKVEGRLDPHFYKPDFLDLIESFKNSNFEVKSLKEISEKITSGATPKSGGADYTSKENGIAFIRSGDINEEGKIDFDSILYVKKEIHNGKLKSSQLKKGDVLIAIVGATIGEVSVYSNDNEANINQAIALVRCKENINPEYIKAFMLSGMGQKQLDKIKRPVARANINLEEIGGFKIPVPPLEIQSKIVEVMQLAYEKKANKEQKTESILNSIDDYILGELGIKIANLKNKHCFSVNFKQVEGKRLDPKGYLDTPWAILKAISKSKYKVKTLSDLLDSSITGEWGEDPVGFENNNDYSLTKVLRNTNFDNMGNLDFDDVAERFIENKKLEKVELKTGDILIEKSGGSPIQPVGRVALIENLKDRFTFSNFLQCFRVKKECLPEYLFCFLKALYGLNYMEYLQNQTTGIKNLIMEEYLSIPVPLPPIGIQKKLADEFRNRLESANKFKVEAIEEVGKAKIFVENLLVAQK